MGYHILFQWMHKWFQPEPRKKFTFLTGREYGYCVYIKCVFYHFFHHVIRFTSIKGSNSPPIPCCQAELSTSCPITSQLVGALFYLGKNRKDWTSSSGLLECYMVLKLYIVAVVVVHTSSCFNNTEDVSNPPIQSILPIWVFQPIFQMKLEKLAKTN